MAAIYQSRPEQEVLKLARGSQTSKKQASNQEEARLIQGRSSQQEAAKRVRGRQVSKKQPGFHEPDQISQKQPNEQDMVKQLDNK